MGCAISSPLTKKKLRYCIKSGVRVKLKVRGGEESKDVVSLCKERKRLVKKALKLRQLFGDAHSKYIHSLSAVSSALSVFVARYSSPISQLYIAFEASDNCGKTQNEETQFAVTGSFEENEEEDDDDEEREFGGICEHFYDDFVNDGNECKWDFFDLLGESKTKEERECKGELKEEEQGKGKGKGKGKGNGDEEGKGKGNGRELLEALKDLEDHFMRAYDSGIEVSRMLEVDKIHSHSQPSFENNVKENASRKRSVSSRSSPCKSFLSSSSWSTSTWAESGGDRKSLLSSSSETSSTVTEHRSDPLDGRWGMVSGSHSFTLGRLYAWEKKLYHEVKAGQHTRKTYKHKRSHLQQKDMEGNDLCPSKASSEVSDLYHQMLVTVQRAESISKQIKKLRDEELQPQLLELINGLMRTWKSMSETHEIQRKIMREINSFNCPEQGKFSSESHRLATLQLEAVIQDWHSCFFEYVSAQKAYVKSLHGWLSKFIDAEAEYHYNSSFTLPTIPFNGPPLIVICQHWSASLERLPDKSVKYTMRSLGKDIQALWVLQGVEQQQKRKVDGLDKGLDRKVSTLKKAEDKAFVVKYTTHRNVEETELLGGKKEQLEFFRKKVEMEREKYLSCVQETERMTMQRLQRGFASVFESLTDFSRASAKVYSDLVAFSQKAKEKNGPSSQ